MFSFCWSEGEYFLAFENYGKINNSFNGEESSMKDFIEIFTKAK